MSWQIVTVAILVICVIMTFSHIIFSSHNADKMMMCEYGGLDKDNNIICTNKRVKNKDSGSCCIACNLFDPPESEDREIKL